MGQRLTLAVQGKMDVVKINGYDDDDDDDDDDDMMSCKLQCQI